MGVNKKPRIPRCGIRGLSVHQLHRVQYIVIQTCQSTACCHNNYADHKNNADSDKVHYHIRTGKVLEAFVFGRKGHYDTEYKAHKGNGEQYSEPEKPGGADRLIFGIGSIGCGSIYRLLIYGLLIDGLRLLIHGLSLHSRLVTVLRLLRCSFLLGCLRSSCMGKAALLLRCRGFDCVCRFFSYGLRCRFFNYGCRFRCGLFDCGCRCGLLGYGRGSGFLCCGSRLFNSRCGCRSAVGAEYRLVLHTGSAFFTEFCHNSNHTFHVYSFLCAETVHISTLMYLSVISVYIRFSYPSRVIVSNYIIFIISVHFFALRAAFPELKSFGECATIMLKKKR